MSKVKKKRCKAKKQTIEICCSEALNDNNLNGATSWECYNCCCFDCTKFDISEFNGKINFALDEFCCEFDSNCIRMQKVSNKKEKQKKNAEWKATPKSYASSTRDTQHAKQNGVATEHVNTKKSPSTTKNYNLIPINDRIEESSRSLSTSDLPSSSLKGSTSLRFRKPKHKSSTKLCNSLKLEIPSQSSKTPPMSLQKLNSQSLTNLIPMTHSDAVKSLLNLSEHDKRILDRMSMKNLKELVQVEHSLKARKFWESEKHENEKAKNEEKKEYLKLVIEKRRREYLDLLSRKRQIEEREKINRIRIQNDIEAKTLKAENLLKNIELDREMQECRRKQRDLQKIEQIQANCAESQLDDQIRRNQLNERLEEKIQKAESIRVKNLDSQRIRVVTENQIHQQIHAQNYDHALREEIMKREMLRQRLNERESKFQKFYKQKEKVLETSKSQAKTSAILRELVRRSFSSFRTPHDVNERGMENGRFSTCSYASHVSHIHLN